jgi:hypothetical protein
MAAAAIALFLGQLSHMFMPDVYGTFDDGTLFQISFASFPLLMTFASQNLSLSRSIMLQNMQSLLPRKHSCQQASFMSFHTLRLTSTRLLVADMQADLQLMISNPFAVFMPAAEDVIGQGMLLC